MLSNAAADGDVDHLLVGLRVLSQALQEPEVSQHVGAEWHEWTPTRTG